MIHNYKLFTVIELLIVVAIIGILTSLLLPSLAAARYQSKTAVCQSSNKQLQIAVITYSIDADSRVLPIRNMGSPQYLRYFYHKDNKTYSNFGILCDDYLVGASLFCPQLNENKAGTKQDYHWYLNDKKEFKPHEALASTNVSAGRSAFNFYPYEMTMNQRKKMTIGAMDNSQMLLSDYIGIKTHSNYGPPGWNVTKVDGSTIFRRNKLAGDYVDANRDIWRKWSKAIIVRELLLSE
jgi:type II secretory pathway pseudopilin PulG